MNVIGKKTNLMVILKTYINEPYVPIKFYNCYINLVLHSKINTIYL